MAPETNAQITPRAGLAGAGVLKPTRLASERVVKVLNRNPFTMTHITVVMLRRHGCGWPDGVGRGSDLADVSRKAGEGGVDLF